ncbi:CDP-alcohol phosphatidyltransferase family protein [Niabella terrae]
MKQIPNLFTLLNLVFGCLAITYILKTDGFLYENSAGLSMGLLTGAIFIGAAALVDFLDGFVARLFHASSEMGAQLDSLADLVSFGVAPSLILFQLLEAALTQNGHPATLSWLLPVWLVPCCGAWRLARFNLDKTQTYFFRGVPIPAAGLTIASFPFIAYSASDAWRQLIFNPWFLYGAVLVISCLMVSRLPLISLKFKNFSLKTNLEKFILLLVALVAILLLGWAAVPVIFLGYVLVSLIFRPQ